MDMIGELLERTRAERALLLAAPAVGEDAHGDVDVARYLLFLLQVNAFVIRLEPVVWAAVARLDTGRPSLRHQLSSYGQELADRGNDAGQDIMAVGGDVLQAHPPATADLNQWTLSLVTVSRPAILLALQFVMEGSAATLALAAATRLRTRLPDLRAYQYLESHHVVDPVYREYLDEQLNQVRPDERSLIVQAAKTTLVLYARVLEQVSQDGPQHLPPITIRDRRPWRWATLGTAELAKGWRGKSDKRKTDPARAPG